MRGKRVSKLRHVSQRALTSRSPCPSWILCMEVRGCQISKAKQSQALNAGDNHKKPGKGHEHNLLAAISVQKFIFPRSLGAPSHFPFPPARAFQLLPFSAPRISDFHSPLIVGTAAEKAEGAANVKSGGVGRCEGEVPPKSSWQLWPRTPLAWIL